MFQLINQLTKNEDLQQDLWVAYLSGTPNHFLHECLLRATTSEIIQNKFKSAIQQLILDPPPQAFIDYLTETECEIVCLLMIGCDLGIISKYNGVSEVRIHQILVALQNSKAWDKTWPSNVLLMMTNASD
jgi:hypothetical protein